MSIFYLLSTFVSCVVLLLPRTPSRRKIGLNCTIWAALTLLAGNSLAQNNLVLKTATDNRVDRNVHVVYNSQDHISVSKSVRGIRSNYYFSYPSDLIINKTVYYSIGKIRYENEASYAPHRKRRRKSTSEDSENEINSKYISPIKTHSSTLNSALPDSNEIRNDPSSSIANNTETYSNQSDASTLSGLTSESSNIDNETAYKELVNNSSSDNFPLTSSAPEKDDDHRLGNNIFQKPDIQNVNSINSTEPHGNNYTTDDGEVSESDLNQLPHQNVSETITNDVFTVPTTEINHVEDVDKPKPIYIQGLFEITGKDCRERPEAGLYEVKAAKLAIEHINRKGVIPGYKLEMYENDTKCDSGVAVDSFFYALYRQPKTMMVLGTGSSEVTERLARVVSRWNIIQVSYGALSPALSDQKNFPRFYRTVAPDSSHNVALLAFIQYFRWDAVAALHEHGDRHALPINKLVTDLEQANISITFTKGVSERDYKDQLKELKVHDSRIVIGSFSHLLLKKIFCQIYHLGMFGAEYAWILQGDIKEAWWKDSSGTDCSDAELQEAVRGLIMVGSHYGTIGSISSISNMTSEGILQSIGYEVSPRDSGFVMQTYDALWVIALALLKSQEAWEAGGQNLTLDDFSYLNNDMAEDISNKLGSLQFIGVSGPISFHRSDRVGITAFHQLQGGDSTLVAFYLPDTAELDFWCPDCKEILWQGGGVPIARKIIKLRVAILDRTVFVCVTTVAVLGVALAITFLSFNLYYRRSKFIKLSSPNLNNFVVVGCVLVYIAVILLGIDHGALASDNHFPFICSARAFLLSGGFSLAFGCMFIKTYRVYHIFIRTNTGIVKSKLLHDQQLLGMVSVLVLIDCVLVTLWVTVDPMERQLRNLTMQVNKAERNVVYLDQREQCNSVHMAKWLGTLYIYKGLLLVVGCYMAWETRHVKIPALNDSQYIGMSVYNVVITSVIVVAMANVIPVERYTLTFILVSTLIFVSTTTTLCLLFVPKIHTILINPEDSTVVATPGVKVECKTRRFVIDEPRESIYRAEVINRVLKRELQELDDELARLTGKPRGPSGKKSQDSKRIRLTSVDSDHQDEDSDDGLPPWLDEYKEYSTNGGDVNWYMTNQRSIPAPGSSLCASALTALRPMFLCPSDEPSSSTQHRNIEMKRQTIDCKENERLVEPREHNVLVRKSLPTVAMTIQDYRPVFGASAKPLSPVRSCLSDRALDSVGGIENSPDLTVRSLTKQHTNMRSSARNFVSQLQNAASAIFTRHLGSDPRLPNFPLNFYDRSNKKGGAKSLGDVSGAMKHCALQRKISSMEDSNLLNTEIGTSGSENLEESRLLSENTTASGDSAWATAPLYYSTSFSTPAEDLSQSTNHQTSSNSQTPTPPLDGLQLPCTASTQGSEGLQHNVVEKDDDFTTASSSGNSENRVKHFDSPSKNHSAQDAKLHHGVEGYSEVPFSHPKESSSNTAADINTSYDNKTNSEMTVSALTNNNPENNVIKCTVDDPQNGEKTTSTLPTPHETTVSHSDRDCHHKHTEDIPEDNGAEVSSCNVVSTERLTFDTSNNSNNIKPIETQGNNASLDCHPDSRSCGSDSAVGSSGGRKLEQSCDEPSFKHDTCITVSPEQKTDKQKSTDDATTQDNPQVQRDSTGDSIFLIERDLIFLQRNGSESIDL